MININIGGIKGLVRIASDVRKNWLIMDVTGRPDIRYDLNSKKFLPLKDGVVDNYYCSHTLEHARLDVLPFLFSEIYRTMKVGGRIRVVVPDVYLAITKYIKKDKRWLNANLKLTTKQRIPYPRTLLGHLMSLFYSLTKDNTRSGHNAVFDMPTLDYYFRQAGFHIITRSNYQKGSDVFRGLDFRKHKDKSLYLEAVK